jgi:hypothetical protein
MITDIKMYDSSFSFRNWEAGQDEINLTDRWILFNAIQDGEPIEIDVTFDIEGTCKWEFTRGSYWDNEPDEITQSDVDIKVTIKEITNNIGTEFDLPTMSIIEEKIKSFF